MRNTDIHFVINIAGFTNVLFNLFPTFSSSSVSNSKTGGGEQNNETLWGGTHTELAVLHYYNILQYILHYITS